MIEWSSIARPLFDKKPGESGKQNQDLTHQRIQDSIKSCMYEKEQWMVD